ncbi:MAG TPA: aminomethyl-transferring glycine dehydrogenase subunit GcvPA [Candidatus Hydrogenedentes bacterium]|nr:aminomethyl-transferring glycine dehydrogenase subunit GcvPA [Candidatus Hydrogenedentota bacterium]
MEWIPLTDADREAMARVVGIGSVDELFGTIPDTLKSGSLRLPEGLDEPALRALASDYAARNRMDLVSFVGGGYYDHYIPAAVDALTSRGEFLTAYTPYQPECAQGTLQAIYEFQAALCRLTDMEVANASLYDGGTAVFEAVTMACRITGRNRVVLDESLNPRWRDMLITHAANLSLDLKTGRDPAGAACVVAQNPTFRGTLWDYSALAEACHADGALLVGVFNPVSLAIVKTPGAMGADIAVGEGQSLGIPLGFGGPYLGLMTARKTFIRKMPGRIAGMTVDHEGRRGFVLTLQAREQHIRREKANSNICSNQALCALRALVYLSLVGPVGLKNVAERCRAGAEWLKRRIAHFAPCANDGPTFNEFTVRLPREAEAVVTDLLSRGFVAGIPLALVGAGNPHELLIAVTEKHAPARLEAFAAALEEVCACG